jgi:hypothetical protein
MIYPGEGEKGAVVIRTKFGEIAADERNFCKPLEVLLADPEWLEDWQVEGGPFCYIEPTLSMPF